ncbi:YqjF family protein [Marisediminicola senii]|uniref:YqjF family protein n=1 Tax=Marisediminicola senii TaxID=2711233 RepID=UPI0013EB222B|nr:DUF2071 domain-containing protein [Marisediminicola senii]
MPSLQPITPSAPPLPGRVVLTQAWRNLTFVHWRVDPAEIAPLLPPGIVPDVYDGSSWVGLIPFGMHDSAVFGGPAVPYFGTFAEVNVRLYGVDHEGRRGVVFRSLEASRLAAVLAARVMFGLPYMWAKATMVTEPDGVLAYRSHRRTRSAPSSFVRVRTTDTAVLDDPLADFLTARWLLFQTHLGRTVAMPNEHRPWPLFEASIDDIRDELLPAAGITSVGTRPPDSVLFSPGVITRFGRPWRIGG